MLCKQYGITQKELSARIGMKENTFNIILGKGNPQLSTLERIAHGFGITVSDLLSEPPVPSSAPAQQPEHTNGQGLFCPHCGGRITLYVRAEDTPSDTQQPKDTEPQER